jgi:hypothetical protein
VTYVVGGTQQFYHTEHAVGGGLLPPSAGRWSVSNPAVASITTTGLATWLAAGDTEIVFTIASPGLLRQGMFHAHVEPVAPTTLSADPSTLPALAVGTLSVVTVSARDASNNPLPGFALDSVESGDPSIAVAVQLSATEFAVVAEQVGSVDITASVGGVDVVVPVTTIAGQLSQAAADARYRRLGITIPDSEVTKTPRVPLGDVSGNVPLPWSLATRAVSMRLVGDATVTLSGVPVGEFAHVDIAQGAGGGWHVTWAFDPGLPPFEWDEGNEDPGLTGANDRQDSFMFYNAGPLFIGSKTWEDVPLP